MYTTMVDEREFAIKPMNCPGAMLVYNSTLHSYKDLPLRMGELGQVHRHEASGALNGLFRVRTFTQDDAHLFMRPDQVEEEVKRLIAFIDRMYSIFGLTYDIELSTRPDDFMGEIAPARRRWATPASQPARHSASMRETARSTDLSWTSISATAWAAYGSAERSRWT